MAAGKHAEQSPEDVRVRLKPFLGVQPGVYLTVLYSLITFSALFFLLFFPGIRSYGSRLTIDSSPDDAAVYVDGRYAGSTPLTVQVASGERTIEVSRFAFLPASATIDVPGRVFASLLFPKRVARHFDLELESGERLLSEAFRELSGWALVSPFSSTYTPEPVASRAMKAFVETGGAAELADAFLTAALLNAAEPPLAADILRAAVYRFSGPGLPTPQSMLETVRFFIQLAGAYENIIFLVSDFAAAGGAERVLERPWYSSLVRRYGESLALGEAPSVDDDRIGFAVREMAGRKFVSIPTGAFVQGYSASGREHPHLRYVKSYFLQQGEVTRGEYAEFLQHNAYWRPENLDALLADGVVTKDYLYDWTRQDRERAQSGEVSRPDQPLRYVSFYAAEAYARWVTSLLPDGFVAGLPTESEWERAAQLVADDPEKVFAVRKTAPSALTVFERARARPAQLLGSLWEWTGSWYFPLAYYATGFDGSTAEERVTRFAGAERVVRGGSWADTVIERIEVSTRGSYRPEWCTPFVGFRLAVVESL